MSNTLKLVRMKMPRLVTVGLLLGFMAMAATLTRAADQASSDAPIHGRYVNISIPGKGKTLSLAEVEIFNGTSSNLALNKPSVQSGTSSGGVAGRAVDGNTSGDWNKNSITKTVEKVDNPAWEVDLGEEYPIDRISLWNRNGYESYLNGVQVLILDSSRKSVWGTVVDSAPKGETGLDVNAPGKVKDLGKIVEAVNADKKSDGKADVPSLPYNTYAVTPEQNRGVLNGPLLNRKVPPKKDSRDTLKAAIEDLIKTYGDKYPKGKEYLAKLDAMKSDAGFKALKREALLANPILDFDKIMLVKRKGFGFPQNWQGNSSLAGGDRNGENELAILSIRDGKLSTVYKPATPKYVGEFDIGYDADKILFSSIASNNAWAIFEIKVDPASGSMIPESLRQVSLDMGNDIDNYDAVYLPSEKIIFNSSSSYAGVPCVKGVDFVANLHVMDKDGTNVRRLCFEQDNDWNPVVMNDGRIMFLRWEYTDSAHYFSRVLMYMNPDGTDQKSFYGSNSYWPNTMFFARQVPGSPSKFTAIVGSHHGAKRSGAMVLFDASRGRFEADGAVQIIGESGNKVEPIVLDNLANAYSPHFMTPYPLNDKYFLASIWNGDWKLCLVDVFDNVLILQEEKGVNFFEPVPFKKRNRPPLVPDRINPESKETTLLISDVQFGPGLRELPKGVAKFMRVYRYEYAPRKSGGHYVMGMESGWDARTLLGTVPLEEDGSVMFKIPANTPVSLQPLDKDGKALQIMRSWLVGMPGETLSCIGCHEDANTASPMKRSLASRNAPKTLTPWYGKARGFSFTREVQPVLDKNCVGCHSKAGMGTPTVKAMIKSNTKRIGTGPNTGQLFSEKGIPDLSTPKASYENIHPFVRRNGPEGDYHLLTPMEFHADTSELVQMLQKGHHNVKLDNEAWDRLLTWIDLNVPFHGTWTEVGAQAKILERRTELSEKYAGIDYNPEVVIDPYKKTETTVMPEPEVKQATAASVKAEGWPFTAEEAARKQDQKEAMKLDLGDNVVIELGRIPAGSFAMGSNDETSMERPVTSVKIAKPFWMGKTEVSLEQYRQFDPNYMNGVYDMHYKDQVHRGYYMNNMKFPVIRVTWEKANEYCAWLSKKTGKKVTLPTEAQWEWACRAGSDKPFWYGDLDTDFSPFANLADVTMKKMAVSGVNPKPIPNPAPSADYEPKDPRFNDMSLHLAPVGTYKPNVWGLKDMHGNVDEWTLSDYVPYPYTDANGKGTADSVKKVVRGGSWHDRPYRSTSSFRLGFPKWQQVYNTGFRVIVED